MPVIMVEVLVNVKLLPTKHCAILLVEKVAAGIGFTVILCAMLSLHPLLENATSLTE